MPTVLPGENLNAAIAALIPGDVLTVVGTHTAETLIAVSGNSTTPITIVGDSAVIQHPDGTGSGGDYAARVTGSYLHIVDITAGTAGKAWVLEGAQHVKLKNCTGTTTTTESFKIRDDSTFIYVEDCTATDAGLGEQFGEGFYVGDASSNWTDGIPDATGFVRFDNCEVVRCYGDGFDIKEGAHDVVVKNCTVDFTQGNAPPVGAQFGDDGVFSRGNDVQFINISILSAPSDGLRLLDTVISSVQYGRGFKVKGGTVNGAGGAGVASNSDDLIVYSDFTATNAAGGRVNVLGGGWETNGDPATFVELSWSSPASSYTLAAPTPSSVPVGLAFETNTAFTISPSLAVVSGTTHPSTSTFPSTTLFPSGTSSSGFPSVVARASGEVTTNQPDHPITLPTGSVAGDLILGVISLDTNPLISTPTGWDKLGQASEGTTVTSAVFYRLLDGSSADAAPTLTVDDQDRSTHITLRITGASGIVTGTAATGSSADGDPPGHTTVTTQNHLWITTHSIDQVTPAAVAPTSYLNLTTKAPSSDFSACTATAERALSASTENPGVFTAVNDEWVCWTVAVAPLVGGGTDLSATVGLATELDTAFDITPATAGAETVTVDPAAEIDTAFSIVPAVGEVVPPDPVPAFALSQVTEWTIYARDNRTLLRVAQLDDYQDAEFVAKFNAVGTWSVQLHRDVFAAIPIEPWNIGVEVVRRLAPGDGGTTVLSGPLASVRRERSNDTNRVTVTGFDDMVWLHNRLASPQPDTAAPPYSTSAHDVRTGQASAVLRDYVAVNAGPGAVAARQVPTLAVTDDPALGFTVTGRARWAVLLELLAELAISGGNLGFHARQSGTSILFAVYQPTDKSASIHFSVELGNLSAYSYEISRPESSYVYVAGGEELTSRIVREGFDGPSQSAWGRIEQFRDQRDTTDTAELDQAVTEHLAENGEQTSLSITPVDLPGQSYGVHYQLGDKVSVVIDGSVISDVIREVRIKLTPNGPQAITPTIGTPGRRDPVRLFRAFRDVQRRVSLLERR